MELTDKKILVTGGDGFLGRHVVAALEARGVRREHIRIPDAHTQDLRVLKNCSAAVQDIDVIFHLAGVTGGIAFHLAHPGSIAFDNVIMGAQLMDEARKAGVQKFITAGSAAEYPQGAPIPYTEKDLWIGAPADSHLSYAAAKKMLAIQAAAYHAQYGFNAVHLLLSNMYGPGQAWESENMIPSTIRRVHEAQQHHDSTFVVWGTGKPTRDFLYVKDAAQAFVAAAEKYDKSEPVNIASGVEISIGHLATTIAELMGFTGEIIYDTTKPDGQMRRVMDCSKAEQEFGFKSVSDLRESIRETIQWALVHQQA